MVVAQGIRDSTAPWRYLRSIESGALYFARCGMGFLSEKSRRGDDKPYIYSSTRYPPRFASALQQLNSYCVH